jgi:hypothetical protein
MGAHNYFAGGTSLVYDRRKRINALFLQQNNKVSYNSICLIMYSTVKLYQAGRPWFNPWSDLYIDRLEFRVFSDKDFN